MLNVPEYKNAEKVFRYFEEISKIPRGSGNTEKIADYLVNFANERGLCVVRDTADNIIISKPATEGYEERPAIIFQGHTDIVAEKEPDSDVDMEKDGLKIFRDGDFIRARGTTLGADDGVAIAYALALLDASDIPHPHFQAVFTTDEEVGLTGANSLDPENLVGELMINIDSDREGIFTAGCAGGVRVDITLDARRRKIAHACSSITVSGLQGGHSGIEIDKGRVNAIKLLGEILSEIPDIKIASLCGGNADNAIPRGAECVFYSDGFNENTADELFKKFREKYSTSEPSLTFEYKKAADFTEAFCDEETEKIIALINEEPSGVIKMSSDIDGLVQTSLNLGIIKTKDTSVSLSFALRSAVGEEKEKLKRSVFEIAEKHGGVCEEHGDYPAWEYRKVSHLRDCMCEVYERLYGKSAEVITIHAGLECGILSDKIEGLDCVSIGPDNFDIHTTNEHLSISSTARVWEFLKEVLKSV